METTIYYFSGTGNSLAVARGLSEKLRETALVPIAKCMKTGNFKASTKRVGFVFPLYFFGLPLIVEDFLKAIDLETAEYIFFVETRGGYWSPECVSGKVKRIIGNKGKMLSSGFKIAMPNNYIKDGYKLNTIRVTESKLKKADKRIPEIAEAINSKREVIERDTFVTSGLAAFVNNIWQGKVNNSDKCFIVDKSCISCSICESACPVGNIKMSEGSPKWQHKCQECLACVHFCPKGSIKSDSKERVSLRYHHPNISHKDICAQK